MTELDKVATEIATKPLDKRVVFGLLFAGFTAGAFVSSVLFYIIYIYCLCLS